MYAPKWLLKEHQRAEIAGLKGVKINLIFVNQKAVKLNSKTKETDDPQNEFGFWESLPFATVEEGWDRKRPGPS